MTSTTREQPSRLKVAGLGALGFVALLWMIEIVDALVNHRLDDLGIRPRSDEGLLGIVFAPLLHGGWVHLEANTLPALVLFFLVLVTGPVAGLEATGIIWLVGGVGVWLVAQPNSIHLGASVLIFGWIVYLVLVGWWSGSVKRILLGVAVVVVYGSVLWGVLPGQPGVSWQGHLFGAIGGGLAAFLIGRDRSEG